MKKMWSQISGIPVTIHESDKVLENSTVHLFTLKPLNNRIFSWVLASASAGRH